MGIGADSVVDPATMRVHGVDRLRVVDASAMPYVTNGNIYAPVMMLAEKSADLIVGNAPLAPIDAQFFRCAGSGGGPGAGAGNSNGEDGLRRPGQTQTGLA